jgi:hypothetical protein
MFKIYSLITTIMIFAIVFDIEAGAVPQLINYQGTIKTSEALTKVKLEFNIYDSATVGTKIWGPQVFDNVPVIQGQFNVILGTTDNSGKSIAEAFASDQRFIGITINNTEELMPRQQVLSVGYAINAEHSVQAAKADEATHAVNADRASHADNATHASNADNAIRSQISDVAKRVEGAASTLGGVVVGKSSDKVKYAYEYETVGVTEPYYNLRLQSSQSIIFHTDMKNHPGGNNDERARMVIHANGNVGIGTMASSKKLEVNGAIGFTGAGRVCIFADRCPNGWTHYGMGGFIMHGDNRCPFSQGAVFNDSGWNWCHPQVCCND